MHWEVIIPIIILIIITGCGIAICYFFVSRFKRIRAKILISFLLFGLLIGCYSFWMGKTDSVAMVNFLGSGISEIVYNDYLIPYWKQTLEPIGYEEIPIYDFPPVAPPEPVGYEEIPIYDFPPVAPPEPPVLGKKVGVEVVPIYDFPLKKVSDLYIPASVVSWGLIGLVIQLIYNGIKRFKGSLRGATPL